MASATSATARANASSFARDGLVDPLTFRTYCSAAACTSSSVAGGSKLWSVLMLRHMVHPLASIANPTRVYGPPAPPPTVRVHHRALAAASACAYTPRMTIQIPLRISERDLSALDEAIARGAFANRSEALRAGLRLLLRAERDREIEEAYRRGYGEHPQEEWVGDAGLALLARFVEAEENGEDRL